MITIFKYDLLVEDYQEIQMPSKAKILSVGVQNNEIKLWALVETNTKVEPRRIRIAGTGHDITEDIVAFLGTVQLHSGRLVFHIFEKF